MKMKNWWRSNRLGYTVLFCLVGIVVSAQKDMKFEDYLKKYKDQSEVVLRDEETYKIKEKDGELQIFKETYFESIILNEQGISNFTEQFYDSELSPVIDFEAYTLSPKGKKLESNLIKESANVDASIFYDEIKRKEITYKGLEPGSKKILKTKIQYKDPNLLSRYIFQSGLFSEKMKFKVEVDNSIDLGYKIFHAEDSNLTFSNKEKRKKTIYTWEVNQMKPYKYELARPGILYTAPHVAIFIKSYDKAPSDAKLLGSVDDLFQYYRGFVDGVNDSKSEQLVSIAKTSNSRSR